ncbi:hypothetical protein [Bacillus cereus]|nr:hypothetical protein [Bacillus cereus]MDA2079499.1 hypothetical protein [Bacillus cereus]MDA2085089.1 hypothetical protein [Bacillus cereus]
MVDYNSGDIVRVFYPNIPKVKSESSDMVEKGGKRYGKIKKSKFNTYEV